MSIVSSLIVELQANTAAFITGMDAASKSTKKVGREIESSFADISEVAERALAPFGELGAAISEAIGAVGSSAGSAIQTLGKMGGVIGGVAAIGGGAVAALGAMSLGAVALATSTAESIAKMGELAQSTGVSVTALSGLSFAGKTAGLSMEQMSGGLEKMDKAVLAAATAPQGATNAFTRLNVAIRDASGQIKPTEQIFADLAGRFAAMPDGITKTALAMQIFGRGGADMIPLLNRGQAGIQELLDTAKALGIQLDTQTVQAAEKFKESLGTVEAAGSGLSIELTKELLPAMQTVADFLVDGLKDKSSGLSDLIASVTFVTKTFVTMGEIVYAAFESVGRGAGVAMAELGAFSVGAAKAMKSATTLDWGGAVAAWKDAQAKLTAMDQFDADQQKKIFADAAVFINGVWSDLAPATPQKPGNDKTDTTPKADPELAAIRDRIALLDSEMAKWVALSNAGTQAEQLITEATAKGNEEFQKLKEQASRDRINPISALAMVSNNEALIKGAAAAQVFGTAIAALNASLDKQGAKFREESLAAVALGAAYRQGGSAIASAMIGNQFVPDETALQKLINTRNMLAAGRSATEMLGPVAPQAEADEYKQLTDAINNGTAALEANKIAASDTAYKDAAAELDKQTRSYTDLAKWVDNLNNSYLRGADAVRAARVELDLYKYVEDELLNKGVTLTPVQIQQKKTDLTAQDDQSYDATIKQQAAQYDLNALFADEITKLEAVKKAIEDTGSSALLINAKLFDSENSLIHQWDTAAMAVGTFGQRFQSVMNELVLQGQQAGEAINKAFVTAIDDAEGQLAKLITGQKHNFKSVFTGLADSIVKAELQSAIGDVAGAFGVKSGKPDGTDNNPFHVVFKGGLLGGASLVPGMTAGGPVDEGTGSGGPGGIAGAILKAFGGGGGGASGGHGTRGGGGLAAILTKFFGGYANKFAMGELSGLTNLASLNASALASQTALGGAGALAGGGEGAGLGMGEDAAADTSIYGGLDFGGFMAAGGDVSPGKAYIVGEKHPELFMPKTHGQIVPQVPGSTGSRGDGKVVNQTVNFNYHQSTDLFKKSNNQLAAEMHRQTTIAAAR